MVFSFLKRKHTQALSEDEVGFVGKSPADVEFLAIGNNQQLLQTLESGLRATFDTLLKNVTLKKDFPQAVTHYFLQISNGATPPVIGRIGPFKDSAGRDYPFILYREIQNPFVTTYPLFTPLLYNQFFTASEQFLEQGKAHCNLEKFIQGLRDLGKADPYLNKKDVLKTILQQLYSISFSQFKNVMRLPLNITNEQALYEWLAGFVAFLKQSLVQMDKINFLFEWAYDDNIHRYVAFICQLIEPLLLAQTKPYQVIWSIRANHVVSCFILIGQPHVMSYPWLFAKDPTLTRDMTFLDLKAVQPLNQSPVPYNLFEVLQALQQMLQ